MGKNINTIKKKTEALVDTSKEVDPEVNAEKIKYPIQWVLEALSPGVKWPGCETDHSPPSGAEVKNVWHYTSSPQYIFIVWCLVKHRDNFTFNLYLYPYI